MTGVWSHVNRAARDVGVLVYAMNQSFTPGFGAMPAGYCFGLAAVWLSHRARLLDYDYNAETQELWFPGPKPYQVQRAFDDTLAASHGDLWAASKAGLVKANMQPFVGRWQSNEGSTIDTTGLYSVINKTDSVTVKGGDGLYIVGMRNAEGKAHAIAIVNEPNQGWRLFDANHGHFRMTGNDYFFKFITWYFKGGVSNYAKDYPKGWVTMGILPPWG